MATLGMERGRLSQAMSRDRTPPTPGFMQQMRSFSRNRSSSRSRRAASPGSFFSRFSSGNSVGRSSITLNDGARISLTNLNSLPQNRKVARIRRWDGHIRDVTEWDALRKDSELWQSDGDCLVYLYAEGASRRGPSFRVSFASLTSADCEPLLYNYMKTNVPSTPTSSNSSELGTFATGYRKYELYIPAPETFEKSSAHDFHLATRNFFAWVFGKPLVGAHLGHALVQLVQRMDMFRTKDQNNVDDVVDYMAEEGLSDFRDSPDHALGGLYFAECFRLRELWTDAFVHCVGMNERLVESTGLESISRKSKALITRARLEMDVRFEWATLALTTFLENELVAASTGLSSAHMGHLERFRSVLHTFYVNSFGYWPPNSMDSRGGSFSRAIYRSMYFEFRNLYEYLVDTQATSDPTKPTMGASSFNVLHNIDAFDAKQKFSSLPNPSPLLPGIPEALLQPQVRQKGAIARLRQFESKSAKSDRRQATLRALRDATNNDKSQVMECALVHVYQDFETQCTTKDEDKISAADGRALRWLLVYGIFQTLISVIRAPREVRHTEGVDYMLCVQTAGTPPWKDLPSAALPPSSRDNLGQEERGRSRDRVDRPVQAMFVEPKVIPTDKTKGPKQTRPRHTAIFVNGYGDGARKYSNDVSPNSSRTTTMTSSTSVSKLSVTHSPHDSGVAPKIPVRSPLHRHVVPSESNIVQSTQMPPASTEVDGSPGPENPLGSHPTSRSSLSLRRQSLQMNADPQTPPIPQLRVDTTPRRGAAPRELELVSRSVPAITVIPRGAPAQEKRSAPVKTREVPTTPRSKESRPQARTHSDTIGSFKSDGTGSSYYDEDEGKREFTAASSAYSLHDGSRDGGYDALSYSAIASVPSIPREIPREALRFTDHTAANTSVPRHQDPSPLAFATQYHDDNLYEVPRVTGRDQQTSAEKAYQDHSRQINAAFAKKRSQPSMNGGNHAKSGSPTVSPGTAFIANPFDSTSANAFVSQQAKHHGMGAQILSNVITPTLIHNTPIASPVIPTHGNLLRTAGRPPSMLGPLPAWSPPSSWQTTAGGSRLPEGMRFPSPSPPLASAARRENPLAAAGKAIASTGGRTDPRPRANTTSAATTAAEGKASYARTGSKPVDAPQVPQLQQRPKKKKSSAGGGGGGGIGGTSKVEMQMALDGPRWSPELQKLMADRSTEDRGRTRHREPYIRVGDVEDEETLGAPEVPMRKIRRAAVGVGR